MSVILNLAQCESVVCLLVDKNKLVVLNIILTDFDTFKPFLENSILLSMVKSSLGIFDNGSDVCVENALLVYFAVGHLRLFWLPEF